MANLPDAEVVDHPRHYTRNPSGIECIEVTQHMNFCRGNVIKYVWRAGEKDPSLELRDLQKAAWYLAREIERVKAAAPGQQEWQAPA